MRDIDSSTECNGSFPKYHGAHALPVVQDELIAEALGLKPKERQLPQGQLDRGELDKLVGKGAAAEGVHRARLVSTAVQ